MEFLEKYRKAQLIENPISKIQYLEEFKALTDSSQLPTAIKERFKRVADRDIKQQIASLENESN